MIRMDYDALEEGEWDFPNPMYLELVTDQLHVIDLESWNRDFMELAASFKRAQKEKEKLCSRCGRGLTAKAWAATEGAERLRNAHPPGPLQLREPLPRHQHPLSGAHSDGHRHRLEANPWGAGDVIKGRMLDMTGIGRRELRGLHFHIILHHFTSF